MSKSNRCSTPATNLAKIFKYASFATKSFQLPFFMSEHKWRRIVNSSQQIEMNKSCNHEGLTISFSNVEPAYSYSEYVHRTHLLMQSCRFQLGQNWIFQTFFRIFCDRNRPCKVILTHNGKSSHKLTSSKMHFTYSLTVIGCSKWVVTIGIDKHYSFWKRVFCYSNKNEKDII